MRNINMCETFIKLLCTAQRDLQLCHLPSISDGGHAPLMVPQIAVSFPRTATHVAPDPAAQVGEYDGHPNDGCILSGASAGPELSRRLQHRNPQTHHPPIEAVAARVRVPQAVAVGNGSTSSGCVGTPLSAPLSLVSVSSSAEYSL